MVKRLAFITADLFKTKPISEPRKSPSPHRLRSFQLATMLSCCSLLSFSSALAQSQVPEQGRGELVDTTPQPIYGMVRGRIVDQTGKGITGADVILMRGQDSVIDEVPSDEEGSFTFAQVAPGPLQLRIIAEGFTTETISGVMHAGENYSFPQVTLSLATQVTEIRVSPFTEAVAQEEFKDLKSQRVLGVVPNFYVSYVGDAAPLTSKRKFQLALKATTDPVSLSAVSIIAGVGQASNRFSGYGQGAQGYAQRYGASYANFASGLFIGGAVLPSILKQDPRYFYKGTGTKRSRFLYAISRTVICKGDNQRWQPNYSSIFGDLAAGSLSNLYIPERDRHGARLTFENAGIAIGTTAAIDVLQEFVLHKFTSRRL